MGETVIVGHGDIARAIIDRPDRCYFASGVSNSSETRESEFAREISLLTHLGSVHLVYFSSLCVFYSDTPYARHKRHMETLIKDMELGGELWGYTIVRLGNILWGDNPHTLINFLRGRLAAGLPLEIQDTYRYVVDLDEFLHWINMIPPWSCEMNVPGTRMTVAEIVREYVLRERDYA